MDTPSGGARGGQPKPGQPGQKPAAPRVNNIKIQIPETTFQALLAQRQQSAQPPGPPQPQMDPRVLQALMQRAQMQGSAGQPPVPAGV